MSLDIQDGKYLQNDKNKMQMKENKTLPGVTTTILRVHVPQYLLQRFCLTLIEHYLLLQQLKFKNVIISIPTYKKRT